MDTRQVLMRAADYIEQHGWQQHSFGTRNGPVCMIGACNTVVTGYPWQPWSEDGNRAAISATIVLADYMRGNVPDWNDEPGRTQDQVTRKLREVAGLLALEARI